MSEARPAGPSPPLEFDAFPSHAELAPSTILQVRLRIRAPAAPLRSARPPVNVALVFDRSGSMREEAKIGYLRRAAHLFVEQLLPSDRVALVAFNHEVEVLVPSHPVIHREYLHHRIDELEAGGYTNLSGGLLEGYAQLEAAGAEGAPPGHVILITDGLANRGITDPARLRAIVEARRQRGVSLSTVGLGLKFDENLLAALAEAGGGRYTYVSSPDEIPAVLQRELGRLLSMAAQNVRVEIDPGAAGEVRRIWGTVNEDPREAPRIDAGDLAAGDERNYLLEVAYPRGRPGERVELGLRLVYDDTEAAVRKTIDRRLLFRVAERPGGEDPAVLTYARLIAELDRIRLAVAGRDEDLARRAVGVLETEYPRLKEAAEASGDQEVLNKAFLFHHFATELAELIERGLLHEHSEARERLKKDLHYRRFLLEHHRGEHH